MHEYPEGKSEMEITAQSKLQDVLNAYPFLEEKIIQIAPPFKNLTNPVLRQTIGRLATLERVASIGNIDVSQLVNWLRREAGMPEYPSSSVSAVGQIALAEEDPGWIKLKPQFVVNGTEMLARGEVPLNKINELLGQLSPDGTILLLTNFEPTPLIEAVKKQNRQVYHKVDPGDSQRHWTFFR